MNSAKVRGRPFAVGEDPRRHPLTLKDRRKGYEVAMRQARMPSRIRSWLWSKIRGYYDRRKGVVRGRN